MEKPSAHERETPGAADKVLGTVDKTAQFGVESMASLMIRYSVPAIVSMLSLQAYSVINMTFVGRNVGTLGIAAIAICTPITMILGAICQLVSNGCAAAVSITLGEGDKEEAGAVLGSAMCFNVLLGCVNMSIGFTFMQFLLRAFGASDAILPYARDYMSVSLFTTFFVIFASMNPMLRIEGYPKLAMFTMLLNTGLNLVLAPVFIFVFEMGVVGAALSTLMGQIASSVWIFLFIIGKNRAVRLRWCYARIRPRIIKRVVQLGLPTFLMQLTQSLLSVVMNKSLGTYGGDMAISAWGITNNINNLVAQPVFGLNQGAQPLIGYNFGAKNYKRVKEALYYTLAAATLFSVIGWLLTRSFPTQIFAFFNPDPSLISIGVRMLTVFRACIFLVGFQQAGAAFFQYCGKPNISVFLTLTRQVLFLIPCIMILSARFGMDGILYSGPISDVLSTVVTAVFIFFELKRLDRLEQENAVTLWQKNYAAESSGGI